MLTLPALRAPREPQYYMGMTPATGAVRDREGTRRGGREPAPILASLAAGLVLQGACGAPPPPVAAPTLGLDRSAVPLGGPLDLTIRFDTASDLAPVDEDYHVLLHFLDQDGALLWADDHEPARPTSEWGPGERIEYARQSVVPMYPYIGETTVALGLYARDSGERVPLAGAEMGDRTYRVASLTLEPQPESAFLFYGDGWHRLESHAGTDWRWTAGTAVVRFRNPRADVELTMHVAGRPDVGDGEQRVALVIGDRTVHDVALRTSDRIVVKHRLSAAELGPDEIVDVRLRVDPTFVPAERNPAATDTRELGVRVFYLFVEPR